MVEAVVEEEGGMPCGVQVYGPVEGVWVSAGKLRRFQLLDPCP